MPKPQRRRTQAERRAAGREALVEGAIACLAERGFAATTSQEICRRADCTTGAIQHHFGSKNGLFIAVLNQLLDEFKAAFAGFPSVTDGLEERCERCVAILYGLYTSPRYGAGQSLVLGAQHDPELRGLVSEQRKGSLAFTRREWLAVFADTGLPEATLVGLLEVVVAVLRDVHYNKTVDATDARARLDHNTALVKRMLIAELRHRR